MLETVLTAWPFCWPRLELEGAATRSSAPSQDSIAKQFGDSGSKLTQLGRPELTPP